MGDCVRYKTNNRKTERDQLEYEVVPYVKTKQMKTRGGFCHGPCSLHEISITDSLIYCFLFNYKDENDTLEGMEGVFLLIIICDRRSPSQFLCRERDEYTYVVSK